MPLTLGQPVYRPRSTNDLKTIVEESLERQAPTPKPRFSRKRTLAESSPGSFLKKLSELQKKRDRQIGKAERVYRKALEVAKKTANAANDLEEAIRLDRAIRMLGGSPLEKLEAQLLDSSWECADGNPWTIHFERSRRCSYGSRNDSEWEPVDDNTVRAGKHPHLWILTFDNERKRARLVGSDKSQRYDLTLVRASK